MKSPFVSELEPGKVATAIFLVQSKEIRQKKTGEPYLSLMLGDRTGELDAKMWDNVAEVMDTFERDDFVRVRGLLQIYNNRPQLTIHKMQRIDEAAIDLADFFPASSRNPEEMWRSCGMLISSMSNPHLRGLLELFLSDEDIVRRYMRAPAAKFIHHAYLGGLIEHVLSVCDLCRMAATHYRAVDLDLLLTGAVLHDIGKIYELSYDRSFGYTSDGQLLGHIFIAGAHGGGEARAAARFSAEVAHAGAAPDPESSWLPRIRLAQAASFSRGFAAPLPRRPGREDGMHARPG